MKKLTIICILLSFLGCNTTKEKTATKTQESEATLEIGREYNVMTLMGQNIEENKLTLKLDAQESRISGFSGCNTYFGQYNLSDNSLVIEGVASTRMYCEASMKVEKEFLGALANAKSFTITDENVMIKDSNDKQLMVLK